MEVLVICRNLQTIIHLIDQDSWIKVYHSKLYQFSLQKPLKCRYTYLKLEFPSTLKRNTKVHTYHHHKWKNWIEITPALREVWFSINLKKLLTVLKWANYNIRNNYKLRRNSNLWSLSLLYHKLNQLAIFMCQERSNQNYSLTNMSHYFYKINQKTFKTILNYGQCKPPLHFRDNTWNPHRLITNCISILLVIKVQ